MAADVDWQFARRVAGRVSGDEPFAGSYHQASLELDLLELTVEAEGLVEAETGLVSSAGPARARVTDRQGWIDANLASFERLMRPLIGRLGHHDGEPDRWRGQPGLIASVGRAVTSAGDAVGPKVAGAELGAMLGWMASRVLGQYDLLIVEDDEPDDQDWVYYVGPNLLSLEKRYGFPPREFRLWIAVHECTHRAQFTGVPWLRPYFLSLVDELLDSVDPDPKRFLDAIGQTVRDARQGTGPSLADGGLSMLFASPEQRETIRKVTGLMSLLEGHGDITMDRATRELIPSQARFARVMSQRRKNASGLSRIVQRLTGLEAKLAQYEEGEDFVRAVETAGGRELFDLVWSGPEALPTIDEIRQPDLWIGRARAPAGA
ncbi:MAG: zinc-dependent metalloprotease [Acidimicrobiales bacterium]